MTEGRRKTRKTNSEFVRKETGRTERYKKESEKIGEIN